MIYLVGKEKWMEVFNRMTEVGENVKKPQIMTKNTFSSRCSSVVDDMIGLCVFILMTVFPLLYANAYTDIMDVKYICYYQTVIGMLVLLLAAVLIMMAMDYKKYKGEHTKKLIGSLLPKNWKRTFFVSDIAAVLFLIATAVSTLCSDYFYESFWGNEGRYSGMFLLSLYVISYLIISRFWKPKGWLMELFLVTGMIMCVIGITDYFRMDVLNFRGPDVPLEESDIFTSTIGNINYYTAYVGMIMGFCAALFLTAKKRWQVMWYYGCMIISFFAIIMGCSDNAYLALAAMFGLLPFAVFQDRQCVKRYLVMLATFFTVVLCIDRINQVFGDTVIGLDSLFGVITSFGGLVYAVILLWVVAAGFWFYDRKKSAAGKKCGNGFVYAWGGFSLLVLLAFAFVVYDANIGGHADRYGAARNYLVFSRSWGSERGYIWGASMKLYQEFSWVKKLFGYGPDTFGILTTSNIIYEMTRITGKLYDCAHNEYLHYLLTVGIVGTAAYVTFLGASIGCMWKNWKKNPYIIGALTAVLCYAFQAIINNSLPLTTPMMWLLLSIGVAGCRRAQEAVADREEL